MPNQNNIKKCYISHTGVRDVRRLLRVEQRQQQQCGWCGCPPNRFLPTINRDVYGATIIDSRLPGQRPKARQGKNRGQLIMGR